MAAGSGRCLSGVGIITLALAACLWPAYCQDLGLSPNDCLIDRIDIIPCTRFRRTSVPGPNQVGIYRTVFRKGGSAGLPTCRISGRDEIIRDIDVVGISNRVYTIFSPTRTDEATYDNQLYVEFNIECGEGRLAFFNITDIDMQPKSCANPSLNNELQCVDYVVVNRGGFGFTEICGNDSSENREQLESTPLQIIFRTSRTERFRGFNGTVICFDPDLRDQPNCTQPTTEMPTTSPGQCGKRDFEMFHKQWQRRAAYIHRMRRQTGGGAGTVKFRFQEIDVPFGINVTFSNGKLELINTINGSVENTIEDVLILQTLDANGDIDALAANDDEVVNPLPGPGLLIVVGRHAYFQLFGLAPNAEAGVIISNLSDKQVQLTAERKSGSVGRRRRRGQEGETLPFADETILLALQNENACNPVLRALANSVIERFATEFMAWF